jgi:hypothetical protein
MAAMLESGDWSLALAHIPSASSRTEQCAPRAFQLLPLTVRLWFDKN